MNLEPLQIIIEGLDEQLGEIFASLQKIELKKLNSGPKKCLHLYYFAILVICNCNALTLLIKIDKLHDSPNTSMSGEHYRHFDRTLETPKQLITVALNTDIMTVVHGTFHSILFKFT